MKDTVMLTIRAWKAAGADRYLLRFETSDPVLYARIHPSRDGSSSDRILQLRRTREMGYEIGSGMMVGIPGQSWQTLANDLALCRELDADMIGVGAFIPTPGTPLGDMTGALPTGEKACIHETADVCRGCMERRIVSIGRGLGRGSGGRRRAARTA